MPGLVGSFFYFSRSDHYRTGEILTEISREYFLVRFDSVQPGEPTPPMELVSASEMATSHDSHWFFFVTREDLDRWIAWLETPSEPRVNVVRSLNPRERH